MQFKTQLKRAIRVFDFAIEVINTIIPFAVWVVMIYSVLKMEYENSILLMFLYVALGFNQTMKKLTKQSEKYEETMSLNANIIYKCIEIIKNEQEG